MPCGHPPDLRSRALRLLGCVTSRPRRLPLIWGSRTSVFGTGWSQPMSMTGASPGCRAMNARSWWRYTARSVSSRWRSRSSSVRAPTSHGRTFSQNDLRPHLGPVCRSAGRKVLSHDEGVPISVSRMAALSGEHDGEDGRRRRPCGVDRQDP